MITITAFQQILSILVCNKREDFMENKFPKKNIMKIAGYLFFVVITFTVSLLVLPYEFFLVSIIVVLIALRGVEKELLKFDVKQLTSFNMKSKTKE